MPRTALAVLVALVLVLAACGDSDSTDADTSSTPSTSAGGSDTSAEGTSPGTETSATAAAGDAEDTSAGTETSAAGATGDAEELADELAESLESAQEAEGGGSATLVVGDQEWEFDSVLCAFGEDEIGQEGAEFVLSSIQDGMQMYASIDSFGHSVSLDDIEDFENPSVSLASTGDGFLVVDGKDVSGETDFIDGTTDGLDATPGTFTATCP